MIVNNGRIWRPVDTPNKFMTSWFQPDTEANRQLQILLSSIHFIVIQGDAFGERLRCVECGGRHNYITLKCIPKPITGLANGLYAYYRAAKDSGVEKNLSPQERHRLIQIEQVLQAMPDLANVHPELARKLVQDIGPRDMQIGAVSLGVLEPISPTQARKFANDINSKGVYPPFRLERPNAAEIGRSVEYRGLSYASHDSRW
jgi:hypothetical protein